MRPRVFPAEDPRLNYEPDPWRGSFNEAAGIPRGRQVVRRPTVDADAASMRPRVFPAEDTVEQFQALDVEKMASMRPRVFPAEDEGDTKLMTELEGLQ